MIFLHHYIKKKCRFKLAPKMSLLIKAILNIHSLQNTEGKPVKEAYLSVKAKTTLSLSRAMGLL